jgi:hypothetical protein
MQINLILGKKRDTIKINDNLDLNQLKNRLPKYIYIAALKNLDIDELNDALELFDPAVSSFKLV